MRQSEQEQKKLMRQLRRKQTNDLKRKNTESYFVHMTQLHRPWAHELLELFKAQDEWPLLPTQLGEYYPEPLDAEVALMMSLLINPKARVLEQVHSMRELIGEHPRKWLDERGFVTLSLGNLQKKTIRGGCTYLRISEAAGRIWQDYTGCRAVAGCESLWDVVHWHEVNEYETALEVISRWVPFVDEYVQRIVLAVLSRADGMGRSLWPVNPSQVMSPDNKEVREFWKIWLPELSMFSWADVAGMMEFGQELDCFIFYLAWRWLNERMPSECKRYVRGYTLRYNRGCTITPGVRKKFKENLPDLSKLKEL